MPEARERGYKKGRFSFNAKQGRCPTCEGQGFHLIEMHFLSDVWVKCDQCKGKRYNRETLAVRYKGYTIADVLEMEISKAAEVFSSQPRIKTNSQNNGGSWFGLYEIRTGRKYAFWW